MIQDFRILHRRKPNVFTGSAESVWSTCLRSLSFGAEDHESHADDELYTRDEAYAFLLEIICGLHSPIVGETEVLGQFKNFAAEWMRNEPRWVPLIQRALSDAKALRAEHLSHLGHQSYGSWLRKNLKATEVHFLGAGHLTQEILPYVLKQASPVHVHVRTPGKVKLADVNVRAMNTRAFTKGALVIAAPMTAREIEAWLNGAMPEQIIDLRDTSTSDPIRLPAERHELKDIFNSIARNRERLGPVVAQVRSAIRERSRKLAGQAILRPQGWDDLCA